MCPHQHIIGHFGDESFQLITCTAIDNQNRTTKRQNTEITQNNAIQSKHSTKNTQKKPAITQRTDKAWFSCLLRHLTGNRLMLCFQIWSPQTAQDLEPTWGQSQYPTRLTVLRLNCWRSDCRCGRINCSRC